MSKELLIRNSTAEFLIFQAEDKAQGVQVFYKDCMVIGYAVYCGYAAFRVCLNE